MIAFLTVSLLNVARAVELRHVELRTAEADIPLYIARPDGPGPFPPVLFIHAKRGIDEAGQRHIRVLARVIWS